MRRGFRVRGSGFRKSKTLRSFFAEPRTPNPDLAAGAGMKRGFRGSGFRKSKTLCSFFAEPRTLNPEPFIALLLLLVATGGGCWSARSTITVTPRGSDQPYALRFNKA